MTRLIWFDLVCHCGSATVVKAQNLDELGRRLEASGWRWQIMGAPLCPYCKARQERKHPEVFGDAETKARAKARGAW